MKREEEIQFVQLTIIASWAAQPSRERKRARERQTAESDTNKASSGVRRIV